MRKTTLLACSLLLSIGANATYKNPSISHQSLMPGDPPVIVRVNAKSQIHEVAKEISQNAPPTIRDSRTKEPPMPQQPDTPIIRDLRTGT